MNARSPKPGWLALNEEGIRSAVDGDRLINNKISTTLTPRKTLSAFAGQMEVPYLI